MRTITIQLPKNIELSDFEVLMIFASKLYDMGHLSSGQAARVVGISRREFIETVGTYGVSVMQYSAEEVLQDLENARKFLKKRDE